MIIIDANLLLYACNADAPQHELAARWLRELFEGDELIGLPWVTLWAFLRISTNSRIWRDPLSPKQAFTMISNWLAQPGVVIVQPGPRHAAILQQLIIANKAHGPLITDAVLAALAAENGAVLASTDEDFRRFPETKWINPCTNR